MRPDDRVRRMIRLDDIARDGNNVAAYCGMPDGPSRVDRVAQFENAMSAVDLPLSLSSAVAASPGHQDNVRRQCFDDLALVDFDCGPLSAARTRRCITTSDAQYVAVLMIRGGSEKLSHGDCRAALHAGDAFLWDCQRPMRFEVEARVRKCTLLIPHAVFDGVHGLPRPKDESGSNISSPAIRLLQNYLEALADALPDLSRAEALAARNAALELLFGALRGFADIGQQGTGPALSATIDRWLDHHLADEDISAGRVGSVHAVSARTVHRVFAERGESLGAVVRQRRLARARADLAATRMSVSAIALRWRFADSSHFSRAFKERFGTTPSDYRGECSRVARDRPASPSSQFAADDRNLAVRDNMMARSRKLRADVTQHTVSEVGFPAQPQPIWTATNED